MAILRRGSGVVRMAAVLAVVFAPVAARATEPTMEYRVKAAFLYNFARFVEWPETRRTGPLVIGVLGADPFHGALNEIARDKRIDDRRIEVRKVTDTESAAACSILFVSASEHPHWREILRPLRHAAVLTVSDAPGFLATGGVMNFYLEDNRVRFELNPAAAARSRLKLSAQLIRLARVEVHDEAEGRK